VNRNVSQTSRILGVDVQQVKTWAGLFKEHLSPQANPAKGRPRTFTDSDVLALMHVARHWEEHPDMEAINIGLNREDHHQDEYRELLYRNTPILQEPPDDLDETWRHGIFLNAAASTSIWSLREATNKARRPSSIQHSKWRAARLGLSGLVRISSYAGVVSEDHWRDSGTHTFARGLCSSRGKAPRPANRPAYTGVDNRTR